MPKIAEQKQTVNREVLIQTLEFVQPGLSPKEIIEQSSCFAFKDGIVMTFNDEVACTAETELKFTGAVQASPLLALLHKIPDTEIELEQTGEELRIYGKRRSAGIRMEAEVTLPVEHVERPTDWKDLPEDFIEALKLAQQCVGSDESKFWTTCVHIHPKWVEACDDAQLIRYKLKTGVDNPVLVRGKSVKHVLDLGITEISESETWVHFRNPGGLVLSCRRHLEEYNDLGQFLKFSGEQLTLPKGLIEAAETASIFSSEHGDEDLVTVLLKPGKLRIYGQGVSGWYKEFKSIKYSGKTLEFMIGPTLLADIVRRMNECEVTESYLKVNGPKWIYVSALNKAKNNGQDEQE